MSAAGGAAGAGGDGGTPPAGTPPPAANGTPPAPPPAAPPARAAAPPTGKGKNKPGKGGKNGQPKAAPFDQHPGFRKRVDQEVARLLRRETGLTMDEIKALAAARAGGQPAAPAAGQPAAVPPAGESRGERKLREENQALKERVQRQHRQIGKFKDGKRADVTALEMKFEAVQSGIAEKYVNFAMSEYRELWMAYQAKPASVAAEIKAAFEKDPIDGRAVFAYIRTQNPMIASGAALPPVEVPLAPSTSPPASRQPGEETPPPKPPGEGGDKPFDASKLSDAEWQKYKRSQGLNF